MSRCWRRGGAVGGAGRPELVGRGAIDVTDATSLRQALLEAQPNAIAHLAAVAFGPDASDDPEKAFRVNVGGTLNLVETVRRELPTAAVLVVGSSEVYRVSQDTRMPLTEASELGPRSPYGLSKAAAEGVALGHASRWKLRIAVARAFNQIGPGQRDVYVVPAIAGRLRDVVEGRADSILIGNIHARRDFTDVRDVVRAYRLILEHLAMDRIGAGGEVFNVASGSSVALRSIVHYLARVAGVDVPLRVDPSLVRPNDPPDIFGDIRRLSSATGWQPAIPLEQTLTDVWLWSQSASQRTGIG